MKNILKSCVKYIIMMQTAVAGSTAKHRWVAFTTVLILLWSVELFLVQAYTLIPPTTTADSVWFTRSAVRLGLDVATCAFLSILLNRFLLIAVFVLEMVFYNTILTYSDYFHQPLSMFDMAANLKEGLVVAPFVLSAMNWSRFALLYVMLMMKTALVGLRPNGLEFRRSQQLFAAMGVYGALLIVGSSTVQPLAIDAASTVEVGTYGYLVPNLISISRTSKDRMLARALAAADVHLDHLTPREAPIVVRDQLIVIQVESLDFNVLDFKIGHQQVAPFLSELRNRAMFYRLEAIHMHGSADADFEALNVSLPSPDENTYKIPGYPYNTALPRFLAAYGYASTALHGAQGDFYDRRQAFRVMGFDHLIFKEELTGVYGQAARGWAVPDAELFNVSTEILLRSTGRVLHFLITVSSHTPFKSLSKAEKKLFPEPKSMAEDYLNSIRYVDRSLAAYIASLPRPATVVIYSDHNVSIRYPGYRSDKEGVHEFIPMFIYDTEQNLAAVQETRESGLAASGKLTLIDLMNYLRNCVRQQQKEGLHVKDAGVRPAGLKS